MKDAVTPAQFAAASMLANLSPERLAVARAVLLEGKSYGEAVAPYGWTRQTAYGAIKAIREHLARYQAACQAEAAATQAPGTPPAAPEAP